MQRRLLAACQLLRLLPWCACRLMSRPCTACWPLQALGGRVVPLRSANLVILADGAARPRLTASKASGAGGGTGSQQQQQAKVYVLAQEWLYELAETHRMPDARQYLA